MRSNQSVAIGNHSGVTSLVAVVSAIWLALVFFLGAGGAFVRAPGSLPLPILIGVTAPIIAFLITLRFSPSFRDFVLSFDFRLAIVIQGWRFAGLGFLALYTHGVLPGLFALPAGVGDIAIGVTAVWMLSALIRQPNFARSRVFVIWNLVGILDLVVAVGTGALSSALAIRFTGQVTTAAMAQLPLVLIPAYFVPLFIMLHLAALLRTRGPMVSGGRAS